MNVAQVPPKHRPEQHAPPLVQPRPSAKQVRGGGTRQVRGAPAHSRPAQQSLAAVHELPAATHAVEQCSAPVASAAQIPEQHSIPELHAAPSAAHMGTVPPQRPAVHARLQHSAALAQATPSAKHASAHTSRPVASAAQTPRQQSALVVHTSPRPRQSPPTSQRRVSMPHVEQQWSEPPELQSSPGGRQRGSRSTSQRPSAAQRLEQQSAAAAQGSPETWQSSPPQTPPWHASEQQSSAVAHGRPSALQSSRHVKDVPPVADPHRPLQHAPALVHGIPERSQRPDSNGTQRPASQRSEQQSVVPAHATPFGRQPVPTQVPVSHVPEQQSPAAAHALPLPTQRAIGPVHDPAVHVAEQHSLGAAHAEAGARHPGSPQTPPTQVPEQQSPGAAHAEAFGRHVVASALGASVAGASDARASIDVGAPSTMPPSMPPGGPPSSPQPATRRMASAARPTDCMRVFVMLPSCAVRVRAPRVPREIPYPVRIHGARRGRARQRPGAC